MNLVPTMHEILQASSCFFSTFHVKKYQYSLLSQELMQKSKQNILYLIIENDDDFINVTSDGMHTMNEIV